MVGVVNYDSNADSWESRGFHEEEIPAACIEQGMVKFLLAFLERAIRDYMELSPSPVGARKSSEFSDGWVESDEWMSAAKFLYCDVRVMEPWNVTFGEICDILDITPSTILGRINQEVGEFDHRNLGQSPVG